MRRSYDFVPKDGSLHERNVSTYPPREANEAGEVHEHCSFVGYDRARKTLVLRQLHPEGSVESGAGKLVFDSERFESFDNSRRARETHEVRSPDGLVGTFELGAPGKPLEVYSCNTLRSEKPKP